MGNFNKIVNIKEFKLIIKRFFFKKYGLDGLYLYFILFLSIK